ncbi:hypothetical protein LUZ60_006073 [Juncus effusus]|nr:hypothetical protein LUZ60_006073 [Juncus effusus]
MADDAPSPQTPPDSSTPPTNSTTPPPTTVSPPAPPSDTTPAPTLSPPATLPPTESPPADATPPQAADVTPPPADVTPPPSPPADVAPPTSGATPVPPASPPPPKSTPIPTTPSSPDQSKSPTPALPGQTPVIAPPTEKSPGKASPIVHSPPPPPIAHNKASPNSPSNNNGGSSDVNLPVVIGVSATIGGLLILFAVVACICCLKKKKKRRHDYPDYGGRANPYYNGGGGGNLPTKWSPPLSNPSNTPSPQGALPPPPGAWGQQPPYPPPPPPPGALNSSDMSSSGPYGPPLPPPSPSVALGGFGSKSTFTFEELSLATNGFSQGNMIGQGGFGYVYKGVLPNGKEVAVKQLKAGSGQGEREFQAEVDIISRVHHRYLVSLVGYCMAGQQRMLIYEFVPNKTLEFHLHGKEVPTMDWPTRLNIALGSAKGLAYLHEDCHPRIIHRDIKSANILLENNFDAKVADFGLAKFTEDTNTHVSTRIMGTFGYLAPEYASSGKLSEKSDVFSFGVMLLELITGRRPVDASIMDDSLVDWARPLMLQALTDNKFEDLVDPRLEGNFNTVEMQRMVASAAACVRHSARRRPKMSQIVRALEGDVSLEDLNEGIRPGQNHAFSSSSDYDTGSYTSNMRQFRRVALDSTDYGNEYSGPTSEYGLNPSDSSSSGEVSTNSRKHQH